MTPTSRADVTMMYLIHDAIRRDLDRLEDGLHQLASMHAGPGRRAMIDALDRTWADFDRYLHEHDTVEDTWLWPALRRACPLTGELLDELAGEHVAIAPLTRVCRSAMVRALTYYPTFEDATRAADAMGALRSELRAHLQHEEDAALPYVADHLGPNWWAVFEARQRKEAGPSGLTRFLPWVLDDADPVRADWLRDQMRTPVYAAGAIFLRRRQRRVAALREM
ncbi:MAG TPA: hemerythrin domain-containing protein [Jatrophihabitantaceae bacterium]|jgi:hemerythrin-like domain-containing protein|nr:hemerythrin domain-containing protein [Jatrophihabitantaceae bacterium]